MATSRGSIHHLIREDVTALLSASIKKNTTQAPSKADRNSAAREISAYFGAPYVHFFPFARTSLFAVLKSLRLPPGSQVLMTPFNISPMLHVIKALKLTPVFVDINLEDFGPQYAELERKLRLKPSCFIMTYLFGAVPNIPLIVDLCGKYNVPLIEDISQVVGARHSGRYLGTFGMASIYSASLTKYIDAYNGSFVLTSHPSVSADLARSEIKLLDPDPSRIRRIIQKTLFWNIALSRIFFSLVTFPLLRIIRYFSEASFQRLLGPSISSDLSGPLPSYYFEDITLIQIKTITNKLRSLQRLISSRRAHANAMLSAISSSALVEAGVLSVPASQALSSSVFWQFIIEVSSTTSARDILFQHRTETGITNLPNLALDSGVHLPNAQKLKSSFIFVPLHKHKTKDDYRDLLNVLK